MLNTHFGILQFQPFRRETHGLIGLEQIRNFSTTMPHPLFSCGNCDLLDIVVHQNIRVSDVTVSDILDSDHLPIIFHIVDHVKIRNLSGPIEKFRVWDRFQSLASELIPSRIETNSGVEAGKAGRNCSASAASAYRLPTSEVTLSGINNNLLV
jgi:hypothetical protein